VVATLACLALMADISDARTAAVLADNI